MSVPGLHLAGQKGSPLQHVAVQRRAMVFLSLVHMLMTVPNLVFLFMRHPLIPFGFCSSYQLLIRFSAYSRGGRQARRQGVEGEFKRSQRRRKGQRRGRREQEEGTYERSRERVWLREEDNMPLQGIGQWVESKFSYSRKGGSTREQRG
jgi:hypothetical protein